jgi:hypothetical protein
VEVSSKLELLEEGVVLLPPPDSRGLGFFSIEPVVLSLRALLGVEGEERFSEEMLLLDATSDERLEPLEEFEIMSWPRAGLERLVEDWLACASAL